MFSVSRLDSASQYQARLDECILYGFEGFITDNIPFDNTLNRSSRVPKYNESNLV